MECLNEKCNINFQLLENRTFQCFSKKQLFVCIRSMFYCFYIVESQNILKLKNLISKYMAIINVESEKIRVESMTINEGQ